MSDQHKIIAQNKKARHDYQILDTFEAGICLLGSEVKSCRQGGVSLMDCYARIDKNEIYLINAHISPYKFANRLNHDPLRKRKLLFHRLEIRKFHGKLREKGQSLIPLKIYFNNRGKIKVELALAKGKKNYDRREDIKKRDMKRDAEQDLKQRR